MGRRGCPGNQLAFWLPWTPLMFPLPLPRNIYLFVLRYWLMKIRAKFNFSLRNSSNSSIFKCNVLWKGPAHSVYIHIIYKLHWKKGFLEISIYDQNLGYMHSDMSNTVHYKRKWQHNTFWRGNALKTVLHKPLVPYNSTTNGLFWYDWRVK